ncbi:hypothetical protein F4680DRAFT_403240 [Xylaria scruposa]|nr:hypothetical protein F4680DRAFT_403240 [Xylaria scruposa]
MSCLELPDTAEVENAAPLNLRYFEKVLPQVNESCHFSSIGRRKALLIGINYFNQRGQLRNCINDVVNISAYIVNHLGYKREDMVILSDELLNPISQPTKANILRGMHWLVKDARRNDSLLFHYSGHGVLAEDLEGDKMDDDEKDGFDNTIFPVDFRQVGHITDEEMHRIMVKPLQEGVHLTAIFDSAHSRSAMDLPYIYSTQGILKEPDLAMEAGQGLLGVISSYSHGDLEDTTESSLFKTLSNAKDSHNRVPATLTLGHHILNNYAGRSSRGNLSTDFGAYGQPTREEQLHDRALATETPPTGVAMFSESKNDPAFPRPLLAETRVEETASRSYRHESTITALEAPTDSGYASATYTKKMWQSSPDQLRIQNVQDPPDNDNEDMATVYSDTSSLASSWKENYILELADDLYDNVSFWNLDFNVKGKIATVLPDLLRDFAFKIGHNAETQMHRDVMVYVHKNRHKIAEIFAEMCSGGAEHMTESDALDSEGMSLKDKINRWFDRWDYDETRRVEWEMSGLDSEDTDPLDSISVDCDSSGSSIHIQAEHRDHKSLTPRVIAYRDFVFHTGAYQWLLAGLFREFRLMSTEPNTIQTIRQTIISSLPSARRVSRKASLESCRARFNIDWDPLAFFAQQRYTTSPAEAIKGVITVTGTSQDAQAATCSEYMKQTWPVTGKIMLQLVKQVLGSETGLRQQCSFPDGTQLCAWTDQSKFVVDVSGVASLAEIGEQLAWLGATLRSSTREKGLVYCTPKIMNVSSNKATPQIENTALLPQLVYEIGFTIDEVETPPQRPNGQCWHDIFRNPVVVKGYPILRRATLNTGLEANLNVLAGLIRTQQVDHFKERFFLKGFSSMLIPTMRDGDTLHWHLFYNSDGSRISYLDNNVTDKGLNTNPSLESLRHILGWCSEAQFYGGSAQATYHVDHAGLPRAHGDCAFSNIRVSAGRLIAGGPPFYIGLKDTPAYLTRNGYIPRLKWISTKFVVLWDEADKRGWLINGTSALLHVVRASLAHDSKDKFKSTFVFKSEDLQESPTPFTANSVIDVLINPDNLKLKLYPENEGYITLKSRIDHFYNILEKLIDYQADIAGYCGINMVNQPRRNLEGWDFTDLAMNQDPLHPCVATIEPRGKGWVDLTRAIQAVTLVGRGFGEIIRPSGTNSCEYWSELPKQKYYLATCISDLGEIMRKNDYHNDTHVRLSDNIIWHTPTTIFGSCRCRGSLGFDHCEPVQTLLPSSLCSILLPRKHSVPQESKGAVIFGHNSTFRWVWGDTGHPNEEELAPSSNASDMDSFYDSGVGTSLVSLKLDHPKPISRASSRTLVQSGAVSPGSRVAIDKEPRTRSDYTVGILCALPKELKAVRALFDKRHDNVDIPRDDSNHYALGEICHHMVVAACLPAGEIGTNSAAHSISNMNRSFPALRLGFCLLVGIGGGAPSEENDIRLGDVVVSLPTGRYSGVLQYDRGKEKENAPFELRGSLAPPPRCLTTAISSLRSDPDIPPDPLRFYLEDIASRLPDYRYPGQGRDKLFRVLCSKCHGLELCPDSTNHIINRSPRLTDQPRIHYGLIASGNRVLQDSKVRDTLAREHGVLCVEMEAAGVVNAGLDCLVIRGISDYADAAKNNEWQEYAAASAAAYAKLLLGVVARKNAYNNENAGNAHVTPAKRTGSELDIYEHHEGPPWKRRRQDKMGVGGHLIRD